MTDPDLFWPAELIELLTQMRFDGRSITEMATALGKSRSAISGKVRRLNLPPPRHPASTMHKTKRISPARLARPLIAMAPKAPPRPPGHPVHFLDVEDQHCRAIVAQADDGLVMFCGEWKRDGSSYCEPHHDLFHLPPQPPRSHHRKES